MDYTLIMSDGLMEYFCTLQKYLLAHSGDGTNMVFRFLYAYIKCLQAALPCMLQFP